MPPTPTPSLSAHPPRDQCLQLFWSLQPRCERRGGLRPRLPGLGAPCRKGPLLCKCFQLNGAGQGAASSPLHSGCHRQELLREARGILSRGLWPQHCPAGSHLTGNRRCFVSGNPDSNPPAVPCCAPPRPWPPAVTTARGPSPAPQTPTHLSSGRRT